MEDSEGESDHGRAQEEYRCIVSTFSVNFPGWNFECAETAGEHIDVFTERFGNVSSMELPHFPNTTAWSGDLLMYVLTWIVGSYHETLGRNRFQNRVWATAQWLAWPEYRACPEETRGYPDRFCKDVHHEQFGQMQSMFWDHNAVRLLAGVSRTFFRMYGYTACIDCGRQKSLKWYNFRSGLFGRECLQCWIAPGRAITQYRDTSEYPGEFFLTDNGHALCGSCYVGRDYHKTYEEAIEDGVIIR